MVLLDPATREFVACHADEDVRRLAFLGDKYPGVDMPVALDQIRGRQVARRKIPSWATVEGIVYPPHLSMEQCSSEATARYKAALVRRLGARTMVDLTGGMGVDCAAMARETERAMYVERQANLCELAQENFPLLGLGHVQVEQGQAEEVLATLDPVHLIYIDPARRDMAGGKTVAITDCTPDVTQLKGMLMEKARWVVIKLSPMLDWHAAVAQLRTETGGVTEVHVLSVDNECKELLLVLSHDREQPLRVYCANDEQVFTYEAEASFPPLTYANPQAGDILWIPNASVMKSGGFIALAAQYGLRGIAPNSHLFLSDTVPADAPARLFRVQSVATLNKKALRQALAGVRKANVAVRNFPMTAVQLRQKLKLADGGELYIFGTTTQEGTHVLIMAHKV